MPPVMFRLPDPMSTLVMPGGGTKDSSSEEPLVFNRNEPPPRSFKLWPRIDGVRSSAYEELVVDVLWLKGVKGEPRIAPEVCALG